MKKRMILIAAGLLLLAGSAMADSLMVTNAAAMGPGAAVNDCAVALNPDGTDATPGDNEPGPCGLEVVHDNTSVAFVQDDSPNDEVIYRFEFIYNPQSVGSSGNGNPFAFTIFTALAANARPNNPANPCPLNPNFPVFPARIFARYGGASLDIPGIRLTMMNNFCGIIGTPPVYWVENEPRKICATIETGAPGSASVAVVGENDTCPPDGDPAYAVAVGNNNEQPIIGARMGNIAVNPYGAGESGSYYLDEFASFRTLAP